MSNLKKQVVPPLDLKKADAKLHRWRKRYANPTKRATLYRKKVLEWVVQSMAFEGQPVSMTRLKALLKERVAQKRGRTVQ